jgi:hypothetical protein
MDSETALTYRRRLLRYLLGGIAGMLALSGRANEPRPAPPTGLKKRPRESVGYRDFPYENRTCAKCMLYVGDGECVIIEGKVSVDGWCNQWTPPTIGQRPRQLRDAAARVIDQRKSTGV